MNIFQFFKFLNSEIMDVVDYHTENTTISVKEIYMQKGVTTIIYEELSMDGFKEHTISVPNSRLVK